MKESKKILISGASGFIGSNVLDYLLKNTDWEFVCIASWRHRGNPKHITPSERVSILTHDLRGRIPDIGQFDFILNLASESHVDRSIMDPLNFIENNISSTLQMLEYARRFPPKLFLQFSTDEVYGAMDHEEWDILLPSNPYAASKAAQEMISISYWKTYKVPVVITNSNNIVGKNQDKEKFIPKIIELVKADQEVEIHVTKGLPGKRYWNPVDNVSDAIKYILTNVEPTIYPNSDRPDKFSLSGGEELDNLEIAQLIAALMNKELKYKLVDAEVIRPGYDQFYSKTKGVLEQMGWKPVQTLREGLSWI